MVIETDISAARELGIPFEMTSVLALSLSNAHLVSHLLVY